MRNVNKSRLPHLPDPGAAFTDGCLHALGGGELFYEHDEATVVRTRKAYEIPEGRIC